MEEANLPDLRWHSRGYLPHVEAEERIQHISFHLADSLPKSAINRMEFELKSLAPEKRTVERRKRLETLIDAGHGSCILREPAIAEIVESTLLHFDGARYFLIAWVIMPNHVHAVIEPHGAWTAASITASWKQFTARKIRAQLYGLDRRIGTPGVPIWHREYWDRYARNEFHLQKMIDYTHQNPVAAGLVKTAAEWPWSSARERNPNTDPRDT